ncbi:MAG TPA: bifunctional precorrin-2 dehydrogenase/sirohydrochlorin ferrochelatase [Candidatus Dormibacteraeota bacterium]|jgi:siroheme synthase-like protein|nr:bifunctional precorrin-2 dehydrogenase/sirohydrochlorin ferrochelatase [Candidatus Dormibacteraeota bacterium]
MAISSRMRPAYYPAMLDLAGRDALLVGGGEVAAQKARPLLEAGVRLRIVAPTLTDALRARVDAGDASWEEREVRPGDVAGAAVVVCATDVRATNRRVFEEASAAGIPVNVVDDPELCSFIVPSVVRRGPLQVAISTGGRSPAFAKFMRLRLEEAIGEEYGALAELAGRMRDRAREAGVGYEARDRIAADALPRLLDLLRAGRAAEAQALADELAQGSARVEEAGTP